jgi:hypothetical protein
VSQRPQDVPHPGALIPAASAAAALTAAGAAPQTAALLLTQAWNTEQQLLARVSCRDKASTSCSTANMSLQPCQRTSKNTLILLWCMDFRSNCLWRPTEL